MSLADGIFERVAGGEDGDMNFALLRLPDADHPVFDGHFPGDPLLPAFVQLAVIQELVGPSFAGVTGVRFRAAARPSEVLRFALRRTAAGLRFEITNGDGGAVAAGGIREAETT